MLDEVLAKESVRRNAKGKWNNTDMAIVPDARPEAPTVRPPVRASRSTSMSRGPIAHSTSSLPNCTPIVQLKFQVRDKCEVDEDNDDLLDVDSESDSEGGGVEGTLIWDDYVEEDDIVETHTLLQD